MAVNFSTKYLKKQDGTQIFFRFWKGKKNYPVLILLHGLGAHSLRFEEMANYFKKENFNVYAFDFTGFGKSQGFKGHIDNFNTYVNETLLILKLSQIEYPKSPKFIIGESMGGVIGLHFARYYQEYINGLILLSPASKIKIHIPFRKKFDAVVSLIFDKFKQYEVPFTKEMITRDYKWQKKLQKDSLDVKTVTAKFYFELDKAMKELKNILPKINLPVYILQAGDDLLIDKEGTKELFNLLNSSSKSFEILENFYHALSIDRDREFVYSLIYRWIDYRLYIENSFNMKG